MDKQSLEVYWRYQTFTNVLSVRRCTEEQNRIYTCGQEIYRKSKKKKISTQES